jgi:uncharacterized protein (DUF2147 family)
MKQLILAAVLALGAGAAAADPVEGMWQTQEDDGAYAHVQMAPCGPNFCGTIARTFKGGAEYKSENLGKTLVIDMAPQGGGAYEGKVWRPSNNKVYYGTISLSGDKMRLAGCVAGGLICSKQTWTRVK